MATKKIDARKIGWQEGLYAASDLAGYFFKNDPVARVFAQFLREVANGKSEPFHATGRGNSARRLYSRKTRQ